jgi:hypothetical protein
MKVRGLFPLNSSRDVSVLVHLIVGGGLWYITFRISLFECELTIT